MADTLLHAGFLSMARGHSAMLMYSNTIRGRHFPVTGCETSQLFLPSGIPANLLVSEHPSSPWTSVALLSIRFLNFQFECFVVFVALSGGLWLRTSFAAANIILFKSSHLPFSPRINHLSVAIVRCT